MELTPLSSTYSRMHFPYLLLSDILGCYIRIYSSQATNVNTPSSPMIAWFSTQDTSQATTTDSSQPIQTSTFFTSSGSSFMPSISFPNVTRHYSTRALYTNTLYNVSTAIPSGHVQH